MTSRIRMRRCVPAVACLLLSMSTTSRAQATPGGVWRDDVTAFAQRVLDAGLAPAMSVAVVSGDRVLYVRGFGVADLATGRRASGDTPFYIASSTKSMTALAVSLAVSRGEIDPTAPMVRYLPDAQLPEGVARESITVSDLLDLTHGLGGGGPIVILTAYTGRYDRRQLPALLRFERPTGHHGTFEYNNLGYNLLGLILERRYGGSWKDLVQREVLDPIGMTATTGYVSHLRRDDIAQPHTFTADGFKRVRLAKDDGNMHAAGGLFASARDLGRYLAVHISDGVVDGERVLPASAVAATHVMRVSQDRQFGPYHRHGWAWGWDVGTYEGDTVLHRFGGFPGYGSRMSFMPQRDFGVVVLVNGDGPAGPAADLVTTFVYDRLLGKPDLAARYTARLDSVEHQAAAARRQIAAQLAQRAQRLAPLPHPLAAYAGVFENPVLGRIEWRVVAGGLEYFMGAVRGRAEIYDAARDQLRVEFGGSGTVASFRFSGDTDNANGLVLFGQSFRRTVGSP